MREEIILILSRSVKAVVKMTIPFILPRPIILSSSRDECSKSTFSMKKGSLKTSRISSKDNPCFFFVHLVLDTIPFIISVYNCHFCPFSIPLLYFFFNIPCKFFYIFVNGCWLQNHASSRRWRTGRSPTPPGMEPVVIHRKQQYYRL